MSDAIERIQARVSARTAAIGDPAPAPNPPADPVAPPASEADLAGRLTDVEAAIVELRGDVDELIQAAVDDALTEMGAMEMDEPAVAAVASPAAPTE